MLSTTTRGPSSIWNFTVASGRVAGERPRHLGEVIARLVVGLLDLIGAGPDLDVVDDPVVAEDQPLAELASVSASRPMNSTIVERALDHLAR